MTAGKVFCPSRIPYALFVLCICVGWNVPPAGVVRAQAKSDNASPKKKVPEEQAPGDVQRKLNVYALKHIDAMRLQQIVEPVLRQIDNSGKVMPDMQSNRLVVYSDGNAMATIEDMVKILDIPVDRRPEDELETKFIPSRWSADPAMHDILKFFLSGSGRMSVDTENNLVVVQDVRESVEKFEQALEKYDLLRRERMTPDKAIEQGATVRVVWLINGIQDANLPTAPDDLLSIVKDLGKLGVNDLRLAAQAIVKTSGGRNFKIRLSATEKVPLQDGAPGQLLEMKRLCNLDATVRAPRGHTVVLGVAPTERKTSVFILQITAGEK
jgi:hypothetical protein